MMAKPSIDEARDCASPLPPMAEAVRSRLALLRELQASLSGSRRALLALDLGGIERGTREQIELGGRLAEDMAAGNRRPGRDLELQRAEDEVRQALRLQAALLARARAKLRVLGNMLAGPSANYAAPPARSLAPPRAWPGEARREF